MKTLFRHSRRNRPLDIILFALIVLGILAVLRFLPEPEPVEVSGIARVIDGDSLRVSGVEIRLLGIDAPESGQSCMRGGASWPCGAAPPVNLETGCKAGSWHARGMSVMFMTGCWPHAGCAARRSTAGWWSRDGRYPIMAIRVLNAPQETQNGGSGRELSFARVIGVKRIASMKTRF